MPLLGHTLTVKYGSSTRSLPREMAISGRFRSSDGRPRESSCKTCSSTWRLIPSIFRFTDAFAASSTAASTAVTSAMLMATNFSRSLRIMGNPPPLWKTLLKKWINLWKR